MPKSPNHQGFSEYLTVSEAAEFLGVSPWTLRNWDKAGRLRPQRHPKNGYRIYRHEDLQAVLDIGPPPADPQPVDWNRLGRAEHFVQFYESDAYLEKSVSGYVSTGLKAGIGTIVVATPAHRNGIERRLAEAGIDLA